MSHKGGELETQRLDMAHDSTSSGPLPPFLMHSYCLLLDHVLVTIKWFWKVYLALSRERVASSLSALIKISIKDKKKNWRVQLVEEDQVSMNFSPGFTAHNNDFLWKKITEKCRFKICPLSISVSSWSRLFVEWWDGSVDVFESQRCDFKVSLDCSVWTEKINQ